MPVLALWAASFPLPRIDGTYLAVAGGAVALNLAANVAFVAALERAALSLTVPLLSLTPAATALFAVPMLGEVPTPVQWLGIALVVAGALFLHLGPGGASWRSLLTDAGPRLMLVVVLAWSLVLPLDKMAVGMVGPAWHALVLSAGVAGGTLALLVLGRRRWTADGAEGRRLPLLAAAILVSSLALGLQLEAIQYLLVGIVETAKRAVGNLMALAVGAAVFREVIGWRVTAAVVAMAAGVALILV